MPDFEKSFTEAVEAGDEARLMAMAASTDWAATDAEVVDRLLRHVGIYGFSGRTSRYEGVVRRMLARGSKPNLASCVLLELNDRANAILDATPAAATHVDDHGATPLHHAAERGNATLAAKLCAAGAPVDAVDEYGETALHKALHAGPWKTRPAHEVIELLRAQGATVDFCTLAALGDAAGLSAALADAPGLANMPDGHGRPALFHAARNNRATAVRTLLAGGADPDLACPDGQTPLSTACLHTLSQECDPEIIRSLLDHGAQPSLPAAIVMEDLDAVRAFVAASPAVLRGQGHESALGYAIHAWRPHALRCLIEEGAVPNTENWRHIERIAGADSPLPSQLRALAATNDPAETEGP